MEIASNENSFEKSGVMGVEKHQERSRAKEGRMEGEGERGLRYDLRSRQGPEHESRRPQEGIWIFICNALGIAEEL